LGKAKTGADNSSVLFTKTVEFLGRKVSADGLEIGNQHLKPVQDWVRPTSTRHVERFLGFIVGALV
jgi:hypothetical protein